MFKINANVFGITQEILKEVPNDIIERVVLGLKNNILDRWKNIQGTLIRKYKSINI
jgi:hypothetical protein